MIYRQPELRGTIAATLMLAALPGLALAERIGVRSGEHDGFTRLVLDLPRSLAWSLQTETAEARLSLEGVSAEFDISDAFRRLSAGRVAGLKAVSNENTLAITLGCDCSIEAFRLGAQMLVVDIRGTTVETGPSPIAENYSEAAAPAFAATSEPAGSTPGRRNFFPFETAAHNGGPTLNFGLRPDNAPAAPLNARTEGSNPAIDSAVPVAAHETPPVHIERARQLSEAEQRLAMQLSRAVSQGLVKPRVAHLPKPSTDTPAHVANVAPDPLAPKHASAEHSLSAPGLNLRAQTSADRDFTLLLDGLTQSADGESCIADSTLDIAGWASEAPFGEQVGALRAVLVSEFDRPDPQAARDLAKLYIHFGFGAEALHALRAASLSGEDTMLLKSLAEIMEYGHANGRGPFWNQFECDTHAALWAILSQPQLAQDTSPNASAVLRAINALPPQIRGFVGPIAAERLTASGRGELAAQVLRIIERGQDAPDASYKMAEAAVHRAGGDMHAAAQSLDSVVNANTALSPRALIALIESRLEARLPLDIQTANLAGAYAHEYRDDALGTELKRVHILALAEAGAYDEAFGEFSLFTAHNPPEKNKRIRSQAMATLAREAGDVAFLKYALDIHDPEKLALSPASADAVARRLITLGFPNKADAYLRPGTDGADSRARRLLRAQAAIAQTKPSRAEADLVGLSGPEADLLRAEARAMSGDHESASHLFAELDHEDDMIGQAWLAANWDVLSESGDPMWQEAAELTAPAQESDPEAPTGVLARNRTLIENSAAARESMVQLLARMSIEENPKPRE